MKTSTKKPKPWRETMLSISPKKSKSSNPEIMAWVAKRNAAIQMSRAYNPKQAKQHRRKKTQTGAAAR